MSIFGAIPFVLTGDIPFYVDALFETVSGFTTTGSSILTDVESISNASLFWRSFSPLDRRYGCVRLYYVDPPYDGRLHDEPHESGEPGTFRQPSGSAHEGYRENIIRHLPCHHAP